MTIWFAVVEAVPPNVQVRDRVAVFDPRVVGFPRTITVQVALAPARLFVLQLSVVIEKFVVSEIAGAEHPVAVAVPAYVSVNVWVLEFAPTSTFPKSWVRGVQAKLAVVPVTVIWFAVVEAVPPKVQVRERVAVFAPAVVGFPRTITVQVALAPARLFVLQLSVVIEKFVVSLIVGAEHPVAVAVPAFVSVKVSVAEFDPTFTLPKSWVRGVHAKEGKIPVTVIWFAVVDAVPPNVQVRERVAVFAPVEVGLPRTITVQVALAPARLPVEQLSVVIVKCVVSLIVGAEQPVAVAVPEFVSVKVSVAEFDPTFTFPKSWVSGVQARVGAIPVTVIWFAVVDAVPPKVQVRERVAVFAPVEVGFPRTITVQVALAPARLFVLQLSVVIVKCVVSLIVGAEHPVAVAVPEFVSVKVSVAEFDPTFTFPKSWVSGLQASVADRPVTVIWFAVVEAVPPNVQVRERVAVFAPAVVGFPRTTTVHVALAPARLFVLQLSVVIEKFVVSEIAGAEHPVAVAVPEFVSVKVWVLEFDPIFTFPKPWVRGDQASEAETPVTVI
jgi:hypothetical protein